MVDGGPKTWRSSEEVRSFRRFEIFCEDEPAVGKMPYTLYNYFALFFFPVLDSRQFFLNVCLCVYLEV